VCTIHWWSVAADVVDRDPDIFVIFSSWSRPPGHEQREAAAGTRHPIGEVRAHDVELRRLCVLAAMAAVGV